MGLPKIKVSTEGVIDSVKEVGTDLADRAWDREKKPRSARLGTGSGKRRLAKLIGQKLQMNLLMLRTKLGA